MIKKKINDKYHTIEAKDNKLTIFFAILLNIKKVKNMKVIILI